MVDKICVLSPVVSFKKVNGIETLESYLKEEHSENYRFDSKRWQDLLDDRIWNLESSEIIGASRIWIIAGKNDSQIKGEDLINFGKEKNIDVKLYDLGHISLSKIPDSVLSEILGFFNG